MNTTTNPSPSPYTLARLAVCRGGHTLSDGTRLLIGTLVEIVDVARDGRRIAPKHAAADDRFLVRTATGATAWVYGTDLGATDSWPV